MKKPRLTLIKNPNFSDSDALDLNELTEAVERYRSARQSNPRSSVPMQNIFVVNPDIDTRTLLAYASENVALATSIAADLTTQLEEPHRSVAYAIHRLAVLAELSLNQLLANIEASESGIKPV
ncbi:DUF6124 family protein [Pseudomonas nunensis]|uniref:DUF6124 family protein n=1 Tax=Pseudomonas nunensis TaxID=2961896 RepID=A0ABY5EFR0_9PSED|nr:DUF6124 family protein [Pseudomonas nunensis]KOY01267.1 hypothetical protein AM274_17480 [Pseudomonas nunensis]KPN92885.1 hypothetical protein AL066_21965 [Pseudomonas nunensis]MCL5226419.1 DUF6124 family protein [Pseudomonas nunensis]UTO13105.1 DUF6124 family protein [Pseudomonas nunensis]